MDPQTIYADVIWCEDRSAELYLDLSVHFCHEIDVSWFWVEMAMEEKQHAGLLHYCLEKHMFAENLPDPSLVQNLRRLLEELRQRTSTPSLSLDEAFEVATQIESSELEDIAQKLTAPIQGPVHIVQKKIALSSQPHLAKLRSAAERFPTSPVVRTRLANRL